MRTLTVNTASAMSDMGVEPSIRISVAWSKLTYRNYSSREDDSGRRPSVLSFSPVNQTAKSDNVGVFSQVNFTLDDYDGTIKDAFDIGNLDGANVFVHYHFHDKTGTDGLRVFTGEITGPISWDEGTRTLKATAQTKIFSNRIGFATEDGQFDVNNDVAVGKVWPTVFGKAAHVPAVLVEREPNTKLQYQFALGDFGDAKLYMLLAGTDGYKKLKLEDRRELVSLKAADADGDTLEAPNKIYLDNGSGFTQDEVISIEIEGIIFKGTIDSGTPNIFNIQEANAAKYMNVAFAARDTEDTDFENRRIAWLADSTQSLENTFIYFRRNENANMYFADGDGKSEEDQLRIVKCVRQIGAKIWLDNPIESRNFVDAEVEDSYTKIDATNEALEVRGLNLSNTKIVFSNALNIANGLLSKRSLRKDEADEIPYGSLISHLEDQKWIKNLTYSAEPGAIVRQWDSKSDIYIANSVESNSVNGVYGVRDVEGKERFMPIPREYYTIMLAKAVAQEAQNIGAPGTVTTIEFDQPLSTYKDQNWKDEIYVTLESTLSSNTATQIDYILSNYTNLTPDSSTFSAAVTALSDKLSHWALLTERDAIQLVESMAWQCGCALRYDNDITEIIIMQNKPSSVKTIDYDNTIFGSINLRSTRKTNLFTVVKGLYRETYKPELETDERGPERYRYYRNNVAEFGYIEKEFDFFIYNNAEAVDNSLNFWGYRLSNVWKLIDLKAVHDTLLVETFDGANVGFSDSSILNGVTFRGVIQDSKINLNDNSLDFMIWLPLTQGSLTEDSLAWQSLLSSTPDNIADTITQYDYDIRLPFKENDIDDWLHRIRKLGETIPRRARVKNPIVLDADSNTLSDQVSVDIYEDGPDTANITDAIVSNICPDLDVIIGQEVFCTTDEAGHIATTGAPPVARLFVEVVNNYHDYFIAKVVDVTNESGEDVLLNVAKPWDLRKTGLDGNTYNLYGDDWDFAYGVTVDERTLTDDSSNSEIQRITSPYFVGARLHVEQLGIYMVNLTVTVSEVDIPLEWIDVNTSGRQWALKFEEA